MPNEIWAQMTDAERLSCIEILMQGQWAPATSLIQLVGAKQDGQVIVKFLGAVPTSQRGTLLLDFEEFLKETVDPGLVVWLEPLADRSSLRNLRGIEIKS